MAKEEGIELDGVVLEALKNTMFRVEVELSNKTCMVTATLGGKLRKHFIKIIPGDKVKVVVSPYDTTKGRIIFRER